MSTTHLAVAVAVVVAVLDLGFLVPALPALRVAPSVVPLVAVLAYPALALVFGISVGVCWLVASTCQAFLHATLGWFL